MPFLLVIVLGETVSLKRFSLERKPSSGHWPEATIGLALTGFGPPFTCFSDGLVDFDKWVWYKAAPQIRVTILF